MAILRGCCARYLNAAPGEPSRIIICITISDLNTMVHVESRNRCCSVRNISATPASLCVAVRICSMYLDLGAAFYQFIWSAMTVDWMESKTLPLHCTDFRLGCPFDRFLKTGFGHLWDFLRSDFKLS